VGATTNATAAAPSNFAPSTSTSTSSSPLSDWSSRVTPALRQLRAACSQTGGDPGIEALTGVLERAFAAEEAVLKQVASSSAAANDDAALELLLAPVAAVAEEAQGLANPPGGRGKAVPRRLNQAKAVAELIPALLWVAYSGPSCGEREREEEKEKSFPPFFFPPSSSSPSSLSSSSSSSSHLFLSFLTLSLPFPLSLSLSLSFTHPPTTPGMSPPPQHVDESWQAAEFFANKAAADFRGGGSASQEPAAEAQALWLRELRGVATALREHVRVTAPQGPAWGVGGGGSAGAAPAAAPAAPQRRAAPPPPPPPPPPGGPGSLLKKEAPTAAAAAPAASSGGGGGGMAAVLAAIASKGDGATKGLKKVTDDMKSKNRGDRTGAVPGAASTPSPAAGVGGAASRTTTASSSSRPLPPPRLACEQGRKWVVENYRGGGPQENHDPSAPIVVDGASAKQSVYVFGCSDVVVKIVGKVNAVSVDSCSRVAVEVDGGVVASVEAVNSSKIVLKNGEGLVATWALDKCSGVSLLLSRASVEGDAQVTTAQCSEVNIVLPESEEEEEAMKRNGGGGEGEEEGSGGGGPTELPVPEQFVTRVVGGKLVTEPVAHSGA